MLAIVSPVIIVIIISINTGVARTFMQKIITLTVSLLFTQQFFAAFTKGAFAKQERALAHFGESAASGR